MGIATAYGGGSASKRRWISSSVNNAYFGREVPISSDVAGHGNLTASVHVGPGKC
jgi:hypothetical protein